MSDQCKHCTARGKIETCHGADCEVRESWYVAALEAELAEAREHERQTHDSLVECANRTVAARTEAIALRAEFARVTCECEHHLCERDEAQAEAAALRAQAERHGRACMNCDGVGVVNGVDCPACDGHGLHIYVEVANLRTQIKKLKKAAHEHLAAPAPAADEEFGPNSRHCGRCDGTGADICGHYDEEEC